MQLSAASTDLATLADPPNKQIDAAVMDYLLIEMVNTLRTSSAVATKRMKDMEKEMMNAGLLTTASTPSGGSSTKKESSARDSTSSLTSKTAKMGIVDEEEEALRTRLEAIGVHVGASYTERCV